VDDSQNGGHDCLENNGMAGESGELAAFVTRANRGVCPEPGQASSNYSEQSSATLHGVEEAGEAGLACWRRRREEVIRRTFLSWPLACLPMERG